MNRGIIFWFYLTFQLIIQRTFELQANLWDYIKMHPKSGTLKIGHEVRLTITMLI